METLPNQETKLKIQIRQGQHVYLAGMTGSGKTTLARYLLTEHPNVISIDSKHDNKWPGWRVTKQVNRAFELGRTIFRPDAFYQISEVYYRAFTEGGWHVHCDEGYMIARRQSSAIGSYPTYYLKGLQSGRSKKLTIWTMTQRPVYLPLFAISEASHIFVFNLGRKSDRMLIASETGRDELEKLPGRYHFWYYNRITETCVRGHVNPATGILYKDK